MLDSITPLILTRNEAPNIARTLEQLRWAPEVIVIDSFSTDATVAIASQFANVRFLQREFDAHASQWSFGLQQVRTPWLLALDADYFVTPELIEEMRTLRPGEETGGARARFLYAIEGRRLRASLYPPRIVLARTSSTTFRQDGHTQRLEVTGAVVDLRAPVVHDDRKSFRDFLVRQKRYMRLEAGKIRGTPSNAGGLATRVRRLVVVAPLAVLFHTLFVRGAILDGWVGLRYGFERFVAESILSLELLRSR